MGPDSGEYSTSTAPKHRTPNLCIEMKTRISLAASLTACLAILTTLLLLNSRKTDSNIPAETQTPAAAIDNQASHAGHDHSAPAPAKAPAVKPPPPQDVLWARPAAEPEFAAFMDWTRRYVSVPDQAGKAALEMEGVELAKARLTALAGLIVNNPERALELAVPETVRKAMPASVQAALEQSVNTRGDYEVICVMPLPGQPAQPMVRSARIGGETFQVFTHGKALDYVTRQGVPLSGIAVPVKAAANPPSNPIGLKPTQLMALNPSPARLLDAGELGSVQVGVEFGGETHFFAAMSQAADWAETAIDAAKLDTPQIPKNLPTAESSYTEGRKRFLLMRVDFPDYTNDVFPTNTALNHMRDMSNFLGQISYYKHIIAPPGHGSDITPIMRMTNNASAYDNAGLSKLYPEARAAAQNVYGYDLSQYDFFFVCTGGRPSYSYAGLGYVGGVGYHLANGYFDVRTSAHEFGHNLGLGHANWWNTGGRSTIGAGTGEEYGDPFDTQGGSGGGNRHFSASFKNRLGWIPNSDAITVTSSGQFRLHAHDMATAPIGLRAIRLNRSSGDPYWIEFRQLWTTYKGLMNGINFRWAGGSSQLLDMTPGSSGGKDDHSLVIGRTFSDPSRNFHVTPIGKGHTYPESIDVVIQFGPFPTNLPPQVLATASPVSASTGQTITFTALATDPNGDALAYSWDFGDGDYSVDNSAITTHSFASAGEYYVEVTVSDMKGGVARDSVIVTIGTPGTYTISGRVLDIQGRPMTGMKVSTSSSRYAFTESDGTYTISRLAAGSYTVSVVDPVRDAWSFVNPFFNNPVTVGPDFTTADFIATTNSLTLYSTIVPKLSTWSYLDDGSDQGTNWITPAFNDTGWSNGAAILGYGQDNETTILSYGTNANEKHITYYFRKTINVANLAAYTNLLLEVLRDDGVVVHFNGLEVYRENMPAGVISNTTPALDALEPDSYLATNLPPSVLIEGPNVIAVEIHQSDATSSDINFDLSLSGLSTSNATGLTMTYISSPAYNQIFTAPTNIPVTAIAQAMVGAASLVEFYVDGTKFGSDASAPFNQTLTNPAAGFHTLQVVATIGSVLQTSAPVVISVVEPVVLPPAVPLTFIPTNAVWAWFFTNVGAPANWQMPTFDDSSWRRGMAKLGFASSTNGFNTVLYGGSSSARYPGAYFRTPFVVEDPAVLTNLTLSLRRDDGAVVYLNGIEILRDNLATNITISYTNLAANAGDNGNTAFTFPLATAPLVIGTNWIAAEVHQSSATSSDLVFQLGLTGLASTNRPRGIWLTSPAGGTQFDLPASVAITAQAVAGGSLGISKVDFFANAVKIGEDATFPFEMTWQDPSGGTVQLTAVATDTAGGSVTSAPVIITLKAPPLGTALVSFGSAWKYLDDGSNQGTNWVAPAFNDRTWMSGAARLGYGEDGEITTVSFGTNSNVKYITTYFRKAFHVPNPGQFGNLLLRLISDDGAVVYLNGAEVYRSNLQSGIVTFNSLALNTVSAPEETTPLDVLLDPARLIAGTNVLAVEVHQAGITSGDLGFDLALVGLKATNPVSAVYLTSPADGTRFNSPANVPFSAYAVAAGQTVSRVEYFAGPMLVGTSVISPYAATWTNAPMGTHQLTAVATYGTNQKMTSAPISVVVGAPPPPITPVYQTLIPAQSLWSYWDNVAAAGSNWMQPGFDDSGWPSAPARFGWGLDGELTTLTEGRITHYFRRWFQVEDAALLTELIFQLSRDDGAVVYLNGREVFRSNMPAGLVDATTLASATVNTPDETTYFETVLATAGAGLVTGSNLVAVELHQGGATSSDAGFDLQLIGSGTTEGRVYFSTPTNNVIYSLTDTADLGAVAWSGSNASISRIEVFVDGIKLVESAGPSLRYLWNNLPPRDHVLTAVATDGNGRTLVSDPLNISVALPIVTATFIPSNSLWKYLDNGSNQGTNWSQPGFNDSTWSNGLARLGYGGDGEVTTVRYGANANNKYITTYFRRTFVPPYGMVVTNLTFNLLRDDGAVVWLNGREVYRVNMPTNIPPSYTNRAPASVGGTDEQRFFATNVTVAGIPAGTNIVAVEIHQNAPDSSDLGFNLDLRGTGYPDDSAPMELNARLDEGNMQLSWPDMAYGYRLYSSPSFFPSPGWSAVPVEPVNVNGRKVVTLPTTNGVLIFRLGRP